MDGLYYLAYIIAIFFIIQWYTSNEASNAGDGGKGLLAMKPPVSGAGAKRGRQKRPLPPVADWSHRPDA